MVETWPVTHTERPLSPERALAVIAGTSDQDNNPRFHGWLRVHELKLSRGTKRDKHPSYRAARAWRWK